MGSRMQFKTKESVLSVSSGCDLASNLLPNTVVLRRIVTEQVLSCCSEMP